MKPMISSRQCGLPQLLMLSVMMLCATQTRAGPQGELDASFGEHGRMALEIAGARFGSAAVRQPGDGKLLFPGNRELPNGSQDFAVLRLNPDGSRDATFGMNGIATVHFANGPAGAVRVALQADGRIVVAGSVEQPGSLSDFALVRLNADGSIDTSFGDLGFRTLDIGSHEFVYDLTLLPSGGFVVVGTTDASDDQDVAFARFDGDGTLDTTFGNGLIPGTVVLGIEGRSDEPYTLLLQSDGKLVSCGNAVDYSELTYAGDMLTIRLRADGVPDPMFGTNGISRIHGSPDYTITQSCVGMPDGKVLLAGYAGSPGIADPMLARLTSDGSIDTTFGNSGYTTFGVSEDAWINGITQLSDGTLAVIGAATPLEHTNVPTYFFLAHMHADTGQLDTTFGDEGITIVDFAHGDQASLAEGWRLVEQPDGKLLAVGQDFTSNLALARVDPSATGNAGIVGLIAESLTGAEGTSLVVTVQRTGGSKGAFSVDYSTVADSATAPADFTDVSGTLTWLDGEAGQKSITVPLSNDGDEEGTERFLILLSGAKGPLSLDQAAVEIGDVEPTPPSNPPTTPPQTENGGGGGGAFGIETILLLGSIYVLAARRRRASGPQPDH